MNKEVGIGLLITVAIAGGLAYRYYGPWPAAQQAPAAPEAPEVSVAPAEEPIQHPVPAGEQPAPLPALADSDAPFRAALAELFGAAPVETSLAPQNLIARLVATIDSLDRGPVPLRTRAIAPVAQPLTVDVANDQIFLSPKNSLRYRPLMAALQTVDGKTLGELYLRYYPLFQQAYVELGFPKGYFNDRLIKIIDHLLATPEVSEPIALVRPKVMYQFADPELERRSSGQKILLRLGAGHAAALKAKLREVRSVIAATSSDRA